MDFNLDFNASYAAAFIMGLFSSLHCIGMCGSIIGTLTLSLDRAVRDNRRSLFGYVLNYNLGRICSYTLSGVVVGFVEYFLTMPFAGGHGYRIMQVLAAMIMSGAGLYIGGWFPQFAYIEKIGSRWWKLVEPFGRRLIPVKTRTHAFLFGMIWGWLPCGLIYTALALSATAGGIAHSAFTMLAFGMGTLPAVMGVGIMTSMLAKLSRIQRFKQLVGVLFIFFALLAAFPELNPMRLHHIMSF
ncbi:MAG: sulfite exporter TauE/SafE family protein [Methylococcales bacterium]|nr:sulfite exporter TauE/SafE family protein [Methylococcales bacterium]